MELGVDCLEVGQLRDVLVVVPHRTIESFFWNHELFIDFLGIQKIFVYLLLLFIRLVRVIHVQNLERVVIELNDIIRVNLHLFLKVSFDYQCFASHHILFVKQYVFSDFISQVVI